MLVDGQAGLFTLRRQTTYTGKKHPRVQRKELKIIKSAPDIQKLYTHHIALYHFFFFTLLGYARGMRKFLQKQGYLAPGIKILDAGCGSGVVTQALHTLASKKQLNNITFHGFDLTPAMLDKFQAWIDKKNISNVSTQQANVLDLSKLPNAWQQYDLVISSAMLEYVPKKSLPLALENLKKLLKPGGKIVIFISRDNWLNRQLIEKWWKAHLYTPQELEKNMHQAGFTNLVHRKFPFPYNYLNTWGIIIEANYL